MGDDRTLGLTGVNLSFNGWTPVEPGDLRFGPWSRPSSPRRWRWPPTAP